MPSRRHLRNVVRSFNIVLMTRAWAPGMIPEFTAADKFRKAREITGMNIEDFAEHIGVHRNTVAKYESEQCAGRKRSTVRLWAVGSGVSYAWLDNGNNPNGGAVDVTASNARWSSTGPDVEHVR